MGDTGFGFSQSASLDEILGTRSASNPTTNNFLEDMDDGFFQPEPYFGSYFAQEPNVLSTSNTDPNLWRENSNLNEDSSSFYGPLNNSSDRHQYPQPSVDQYGGTTVYTDADNTTAKPTTDLPGTPVPDVGDEVEIASDRFAASRDIFQQPLHQAKTITNGSSKNAETVSAVISVNETSLLVIPVGSVILAPTPQLPTFHTLTQTIPHTLSIYPNISSRQESDIEDSVPPKRYKKSHPSRGDPGYEEYREKNNRHCKDYRAREKLKKREQEMKFSQLQNKIDDLESAQKTESDRRQNQFALLRNELDELKTRQSENQSEQRS